MNTRGVSALQIEKKVLDECCWDFRLPPRSRIQQNMVEVTGGTGFIFQELKFKTGLLANVDHELMFAIYPNQVNIYLSVPCKKMHYRYGLKSPSKLQLFSQDKLKATKDLKFSRDDLSNSPVPHYMYAAVWINTDDSWDDSIDMMRVTLYLEYQEVGEVVPYVHSDIRRNLKSRFSPLELDASELFLSKDFSDTLIVCKGDEFPVHRFLLTCKSVVFKQMFSHNMKEAKEGRIVIEDMEPKVVKELLRFLYCGKVNNIKDMCDELYIAADKYNLQLLKDQCELVLLANVTPENAMGMYMLADTHNGAALMEEAIRVLKNHKAEVVPDSKTFKEFTLRFPELMFELYKL